MKDRDHWQSAAGNFENEYLKFKGLYDDMKPKYEKLQNDPTAVKLTEAEAKLKEKEALLQAANADVAKLATTQAELERSKKEVDELRAQVKAQSLMDADELPKVDLAKLQAMLEALWKPTTTFQADMQRRHIDAIRRPYLKEIKVRDINSSSKPKPEVTINFTEVLIDPSMIAAFTSALNQYVTVWQSNAKWTSDPNEKLLPGYKELTKAPIPDNSWLFQVQGTNLFINSSVMEGIFQNIENYINPLKRKAKPALGASTDKYMAKLRLEHALEEDVTYIGKLKLDISYVPAYFVLLGLSVMPSIVHDKTNVTWRFPSLPPSQINVARSRQYTYMDGVGKFRFSNAFMKTIEDDIYVPASYDELKGTMYPVVVGGAAAAAVKEQFDPDDFFLNFNLP
jgi:hypothetical protein